jgi:hypothetical protein
MRLKPLKLNELLQFVFDRQNFGIGSYSQMELVNTHYYSSCFDGYFISQTDFIENCFRLFPSLYLYVFFEIHFHYYFCSSVNLSPLAFSVYASSEYLLITSGISAQWPTILQFAPSFVFRFLSTASCINNLAHFL